MKTCKAGLHQYDGKQCGPCQKLWWDKVKASRRAAKQAYDSENRERFSLRQKAQRATKRQELLLSYKEYRSKPENKAKRSFYQQNRNARKLQRTPSWLTAEQYAEIEQFYQDAKDLAWLSLEPLEVDHIVPLQGKNVSGLHVPWNLQIIPASQNLAKGNR